tara:strand:- start:1592 stop:2494 length:903 start_codon:yes stop_codon:yes gene_type:complete
MNNEENTQGGNPNAAEDAVFGSASDDFFDALDQDVNGLVSENNVGNDTQMETPVQQDPSQQVQTQTPDGALESEVSNLKKRYSDSSREAQNLRAQLNELKPFVPVLDAMKKDDGLVNHVKDYFKNGGELNQDIKSQLKLDEDFEFDPDEMVQNQDSDSRKVFNAMVDKVVQQRIGETVESIDKKNNQEAWNQHLNNQAVDFMQKNSLTEQEFQNFVTEAQHKFQNEGMSFDDMWLLVNKDKAVQNVANSTKKDMLNQMKNVRNMPTSQSASNNAGKPSNVTNDIFDALLDSDGNIEKLLG